MRPRSAAVIACRVIAILLGVQAITASISILIFTEGHLEGTGQIWAVTGTTAVIAWLLWITAVGLGAAMARGTPDEAPTSPRPTANAHAVALSVVGVVLIVEAIPGLVALAASEGAGFPPRLGPFALPGGEFASFFDRGAAVLTQVVRIILGAILIYGAGDLARSLARRYPEPERPAPATPEEG